MAGIQAENLPGYDCILNPKRSWFEAVLGFLRGRNSTGLYVFGSLAILAYIANGILRDGSSLALQIFSVLHW